MNVEDIISSIQAGLPDAEVFLKDLTGGGDHFEAVVVSDSFVGKSRIEQHRIVMERLSASFNGPLHALTLKTYTKEAWENL